MKKISLWNIIHIAYAVLIVSMVMLAFYHTVILQKFDVVEIYDSLEE